MAHAKTSSVRGGASLDIFDRFWQIPPAMSDQNAPGEIILEGIHCTLTIRRPASGVIHAIYKGPDIGEFGDAPFLELSKDLAPGLPVELFIDARECPGPSINVSNDWAKWMCAHRNQVHRINILSGSRFVDVTASFVRRFTEFGERLRVYTEREVFYQALSAATGVQYLPPTPGS